MQKKKIFSIKKLKTELKFLMFCVGLIDKLSCPNWKSLFLYSTVFFLLKASVDKSGVVTNQKNPQGTQKLSSLKSFKIQTLPSGIFTTVTIRNGFLIKFEIAKLKQRKNRSTDNGNMAKQLNVTLSVS